MNYHEGILSLLLCRLHYRFNRLIWNLKRFFSFFVFCFVVVCRPTMRVIEFDSKRNIKKKMYDPPLFFVVVRCLDVRRKNGSVWWRTTQVRVIVRRLLVLPILLDITVRVKVIFIRKFIHSYICIYIYVCVCRLISFLFT